MAQALSIAVKQSDLRRLAKSVKKIKRFVENPLSTNVLRKVDQRITNIAQRRKREIERLQKDPATIERMDRRIRSGEERETYKGTRRRSRRANLNRYGKDTGTLFNDLFNPRLKPGNENDILHKKIRIYRNVFASYSWVYKEDEQPNRIAFGIRDRIRKKTGYFLFNRANRETIKNYLLRLLKLELR